MQQSSATPKKLRCRDWVAEDCCILSLLLAVPSCIYSFWHGVIPTSYFIFILVIIHSPYYPLAFLNPLYAIVQFSHIPCIVIPPVDHLCARYWLHLQRSTESDNIYHVMDERRMNTHYTAHGACAMHTGLTLVGKGL